jgi:hypothetical protein
VKVGYKIRILLIHGSHLVNGHLWLQVFLKAQTLINTILLM